jgi:hypothetical protein
MPTLLQSRMSITIVAHDYKLQSHMSTTIVTHDYWFFKWESHGIEQRFSY